MIILHNRHDKRSRDFVAQYPQIQALDFYDDDDRARWLQEGGTLALSAFPSVLCRHDRYMFYDEETGDDDVIDPGWDTVRLPDSLDTPLPAEGQPVEVGIYVYGDGWVVCRQAHTRMHYPPEQTPALFSVWRPDSDRLYWIPNEQVEVDDIRSYDGVDYQCIQAHTTQPDYTPPKTLAVLWKRAPTDDVDPWEPGQVYDAAVLVTHIDRIWLSLMAGNSYEPGQVGSWRDQSDPPMWVAPAGSVGLWHEDDDVTHAGWIWRSTVDNNAWEPGVYGWIQIEELL